MEQLALHGAAHLKRFETGRAVDTVKVNADQRAQRLAGIIKNIQARDHLDLRDRPGSQVAPRRSLDGQERPERPGASGTVMEALAHR